MHTPRTVLLQTLGHFVLGHAAPADFAEFLRQRVEANYFAAAVLVPERPAAAFLREAKERQERVGGGPAGRVLRLLRDGGAQVHQPGHPPPRAELPLRQERRGRDHLQGLRERRRRVPRGRHRRDRGAADVPPVVGRQVFSSADRFSPLYQYSDTPSGTYWCVAQIDPGLERRLRRSRLACRTSSRAGSEAATPPGGWLRCARRPSAASGRPPGLPSAGRAWHGRPRVRTRIFSRRCRPAASPALTRRTCMSSSTGTTRTRPPAGCWIARSHTPDVARSRDPAHGGPG